MPPQQRARGVADDLRSELTNSKEKQTPTANGSTNAKGRRNGNSNGTKASNVLPAKLESPLTPQEGQNGVGSRLRHLRFVSKASVNDIYVDRLDCNRRLDIKRLSPDAPSTDTSCLRNGLQSTHSLPFRHKQAIADYG